MSMEFDGTGGYMIYPRTVAADFPTVSHAFWAKIPEDGGGMVVCYHDRISGPPILHYGYHIVIGEVGVEGDPRFFPQFTLYTLDGAFQVYLPAPYPVCDGGWHHWAFTYDKDATPTAHIYLDAVDLTLSYLPSAPTNLIDYSSDISGHFIGRFQYTNLGYFEGELAELIEYVDALTQAQVDALYAGGMIVTGMPLTIAYPTSRLQAYFRFNDYADGTTGPAVYPQDYSGQGNHVKLMTDDRMWYRAAPVATLGGAPVLIE